MNQRPSRSEIRRRALKAAATVALAVHSGGCWLPEVDADEDPADCTETTTPTTTATADTGPVVAETGDTAAVDTASVDTAPSEPPVPDCSAMPIDECCTAWMDYCEDWHAIESSDWMECVYGPGFDGSTGCIPWGPPVPPRMRRMS